MARREPRRIGEDRIGGRPHSAAKQRIDFFPSHHVSARPPALLTLVCQGVGGAATTSWAGLGATALREGRPPPDRIGHLFPEGIGGPPRRGSGMEADCLGVLGRTHRQKRTRGGGVVRVCACAGTDRRAARREGWIGRDLSFRREDRWRGPHGDAARERSHHVSARPPCPNPGLSGRWAGAAALPPGQGRPARPGPAPTGPHCCRAHN